MDLDPLIISLKIKRYRNLAEKKVSTFPATCHVAFRVVSLLKEVTAFPYELQGRSRCRRWP